MRLCAAPKLAAEKTILPMKKTDSEPKSKGTLIAERARARVNTYSEEKRRELLDRGMAMIYGAAKPAKSHGNRR